MLLVVFSLKIVDFVIFSCLDLCYIICKIQNAELKT